MSQYVQNDRDGVIVDKVDVASYLTSISKAARLRSWIEKKWKKGGVIHIHLPQDPITLLTYLSVPTI